MIESFCEKWGEPERYVGKYVMVTDCSVKSYRQYNLEGHKGYVRNYRSTPGSPCMITALAVEIEGKENPSSARGLFWLKPADLTIIEKENNDMAININNVMEGYKICEAFFKNANEMYYGIYYGEVEDNSLAVVQFNGRREIVTIVHADITLEELDSDTSYLKFELVGIVDDSAYKDRQEKLKKLKELKVKMQERAAKFREEQFWKMIAQEDVEMAELLKEYDKYAK